MTWRWISKPALLLLHGESVAEHGGAAGLRDEGLLDSALARPLNLLAYASPTEPPDVATLAAGYCIGLAPNHPFIDGNKRAALLATGLFLYLNGYRLRATQADTTLTILAVAAGELSEDSFAAWLRAHIAPVKREGGE
jgi:death-on-curing protein